MYLLDNPNFSLIPTPIQGRIQGGGAEGSMAPPSSEQSL